MCCHCSTTPLLPTLKKLKLQIHYLATLTTALTPESTHSISSIKTLLNSLTLSDLNISPQMHSPIEYYHIHNTDHYTIMVFAMQKGQKMPIHDHPGMTVFSKLLYGSMKVETYTATSLHSSQTLDPSSQVLTILPSSEASIHSFTACSDQVYFIDVITPPYHDNCTYYSVKDGVLVKDDGGVLEGNKRPYNGPRVFTKNGDVIPMEEVFKNERICNSVKTSEAM